MGAINVIRERLGSFFGGLKGWQPLVAAAVATIAAIIAWNAYRTTVRQVHLTELSQAGREEEEALRDFEALKSSIRRFEFLRNEMVAVDAAKTKGTEKLEWWEIYSGWHDRGLLTVDDRETVRAGHPSIDLERAVKALHTRMSAFSSVRHQDEETLKEQRSAQDPRGLKAYARSEFGAAAIQQLESDMLGLRQEFMRAFDESKNKVDHYRRLRDQKRDRVKLLEKQTGQ